MLALCGATQSLFAQLSAKPADVQWQQPFLTFQAWQGTPGPYASVVADAQARSGKAVAVAAGVCRDSNIVSGGWTPVKTDASYEMAFRLRMNMKDVHVKEKATVAYAGTENISAAAVMHMPSPLRLEVLYRAKRDDPSTEAVLQWYVIDAASVDAVLAYHDYVLKFTRPISGVVGYRIYLFGRAYCSVWVDQVSLRETTLPTEAEQLKAVKTDGPLLINHRQPTTLVWAGPYNWVYRIPDVIGGKCVMLHGTKDMAGIGSMPTLPDSAAELSKYDVIVASEVELGSLTPKQRLLLSQFVHSGGGLVLLGGFLGYGKSQVHVSPLLQEMLPVTTRGLWDLRKAPSGGYTAQPTTARLRGLSWNTGPRVLYYHTVEVKKDARVWLTGSSGKSTAPLAGHPSLWLGASDCLSRH